MGKWKSHPVLLRGSQKAPLTYCPRYAPNKNPWKMFHFGKRRISFGDWTAQGLVQFLVLQPRCTVDVSFYVSKAFLSSVRADVTEPWSFSGFLFVSVTSIPSLLPRVTVMELAFPHHLSVCLPFHDQPNPPLPIFSHLPLPGYFKKKITEFGYHPSQSTRGMRTYHYFKLFHGAKSSSHCIF